MKTNRQKSTEDQMYVPPPPIALPLLVLGLVMGLTDLAVPGADERPTTKLPVTIVLVR